MRAGLSASATTSASRRLPSSRPAPLLRLSPHSRPPKLRHQRHHVPLHPALHDLPAHNSVDRCPGDGREPLCRRYPQKLGRLGCTRPPVRCHRERCASGVPSPPSSLSVCSSPLEL